MNNMAKNLVQNPTGPQQQQQQQHHHPRPRPHPHHNNNNNQNNNINNNNNHHHYQEQAAVTTTRSIAVTNLNNDTGKNISNNDNINVVNTLNTGGSSAGGATSTTSSIDAPAVSGSLKGFSASNNSHNSQTTSSSAAAAALTNGSLSDSFASSDGGHRNHNVKLSKTNLYIKGLHANTTDEDLYKMCSRFGQISSTKAILEKATGCCRGFGFVQFAVSSDAMFAISQLTKAGIIAKFARVSYQQPHYNHHHSNNNNNNSSNNNSQLQLNQNSPNTNDADPTNLYIANLPPNMSEQELENLLSTYGPVVSTRILRDQSNIPRGVGFARMESRDKCEQIIEHLNGRPCKGGKEPLLVKFADGKKKTHHHNNQHQHQHQQQHQNNNLHQQHHKAHQDDSRWRESSNTSDLGSASSFDHQGNISHSNHLSDLAMMSTLGYPRMQPAFPPTVATGAAYPPPLGPPTSAPQWIHPGGPGQPYVIPQQMIQAGGLGPSNQAAAAAALHYGHIPQLTSQMQGLQIAHPGAPVGGYLPPHQWSTLWTHPIQQQTQPSMRIPASLHPLPPSQQQSPPQSTPVQQQQQHQHQHQHHQHHQQQQQQQQHQHQPQSQQPQPPIQHHQPPVTDNKLQVSVPL